MDMQTAAPPTVRPQPRRRWWWVTARFAGGIGVLLILGLVGTWWWGQRSMEIAWSEAVKEAELDLPRWRLMEIEEDRPKIPDAENSALHIIAVRRMGANVWVNGKESWAAETKRYEQVFEKLPPTAMLNEQQRELIRKELAKVANPLIEARKLKDMPRGRFPITYSIDYIGTQVEEQQRARQIADWLQHDAMLLADEERYDQAVESCQAILNASRALEGEQTLIGLLIRMALQHITHTTLERVLAQGQVSEHALLTMQASIEKDAQTSGWLAAIRGERAGHHYLFDNMRTGKLDYRGIISAFPGGVRSLDDWMIDNFPTIMLKYYPAHLRKLNRVVEIAKLPIHERGPLLEEFERQWQVENKETENFVSSVLMPATLKVHQAEVRSQALVRSAAVALACERYRLKYKDNKIENAWPASLDLLVKDKLIEAIPLDPIDGQPIRYRKTKDGIVVYSFGFDKKDDQGNIDRDRPPTDPGLDIGFRLWNVDQRRQPALPPVKLKDGE